MPASNDGGLSMKIVRLASLIGFAALPMLAAAFQRVPFGIPSGWSTFEQGMSEELQDIR